MKTLKTTMLLFMALMYAATVNAQDVSGVWVGNYDKAFLTVRPLKLVVELFQYNDSLLAGASHLYYRNNHYEHYTLIGKFDKRDSTVYFKEDSTIGVHLGFGASNFLGNYTTKWIVTDTAEILDGKFRDNSTGLLHAPTTSVTLKKKIPKIAPISKDRNLERATIIQQLVELPSNEKDSIKVEIYDDKEIDGDIISLYLNDSTVLYKQTLAAKPIVTYISINNKEDISKLKMAAESMGSDPPCTAMMMITTTRGKKYQFSLSSNYSSNAVVEFFVKE